MGDEQKITVRTMDGGALVGPLWLFGWLFTLGYTGLTGGKAALALIAWPYFLGLALKP